MSPKAQIHAILLCALLLIVQSALGAPTDIERHKRQSFNSSTEVSDTGNEASNYCDDACIHLCLFAGVCDEPQCENYTCDYDYYQESADDVPRVKSNVTEGGTTLKPNDEGRSNLMNLECLHGILKDDLFCECDEGWIGIVCNVPCTLKCVHGHCVVKPEATLSHKVTEDDMLCNCDSNYHKERCTEKIPDPAEITETNARSLILGICLGMVGLIAVIIVIVVWRKRMMSAMKTVYFLKAKEARDGKTYDAYISTGTADRALKFVNNLLAPKLEQQGFKLFIPSPDQLTGAFISDDVVTAIKQSRRIIIVVTPEYLQNEWIGFKAFNAQPEMKTLQKRIIPVILEDFQFSKETTKVQKCLKNILDPAKCLKVPGYKSASPDLMQKSGFKEEMDKFWYRLELAMSEKQ